MKSSSAGLKVNFESSCIRKIKAEEVHEVWSLEAQSYPEIPAEHLPIERYTRAQRDAPELFWGHFGNGKMTGFIFGTRGAGSKWKYDSMFKHDSEGAVAYLNLVCVYPELRRKGIGSLLVKHWVTYIEENHKDVTKMCFICEDELIPFYKQLGFTYVGPSDVSQLGPTQWYDMECRGPAYPKDAVNALI
ncbi:serotonin N-acetyltransferase-like [Patiria miniata]|uniref:Serotonin N-acetyltransferase n=1 Tax=Patiria miniata TaxID=46514 RepID=A0A913ZL13_PATMI|nr:serotonin N-acetyltransferase-like [Patiria miniata]